MGILNQQIPMIGPGTHGHERTGKYLGKWRAMYRTDAPSVAPFPISHSVALSSPHRVVAAAAVVAPAPHQTALRPSSLLKFPLHSLLATRASASYSASLGEHRSAVVQLGRSACTLLGLHEDGWEWGGVSDGLACRRCAAASAAPRFSEVAVGASKVGPTREAAKWPPKMT